MRIQHSHGKGIFVIVKRLKYPYHHLKQPATDHRPPPATVHRRCLPLAAGHRHCRPPHATVTAIAVVHHHRCNQPPSAAVTTTSQPVATTSIKSFFGNLSNIPGNSICIINIPKISYPGKLFPKIAFFGILFPAIETHSIYLGVV